MKKLPLIILLVLCGTMISSAQQAPLYSQYMLNGFLLNPAVAGSEGYSALNLTAREQWLGFAGGPATYALSFQSRIARRSHISRTSSVRRRNNYNSKNGNVGLGGIYFRIGMVPLKDWALKPLMPTTSNWMNRSYLLDCLWWDISINSMRIRLYWMLTEIICGWVPINRYLFRMPMRVSILQPGIYGQDSLWISCSNLCLNLGMQAMISLLWSVSTISWGDTIFE